MLHPLYRLCPTTGENGEEREREGGTERERERERKRERNRERERERDREAEREGREKGEREREGSEVEIGGGVSRGGEKGGEIDEMREVE